MAINGMPVGGPYSGVAHNGMQLMGNESTCDSLVAMLGPRSGGSPHHLGLQGPRSGHGRGIEDAVVGLQGSGQKRPYWDLATVEDGALDEGDEVGEDCSPGGSQLEKKRRLTFDQVRSLEENFGMENKLEPERKMQLAKELGLRPRQVAVWFQNRRARWKTKQLERDYETLAQDYKLLKADYEQVLGEKNNLRAELQRLSGAPVRSAPTVDVALASKDTAETSGSSNSSDILDAESPRPVDSGSLSPTSGADHQELNFQEQVHGPSSPEFPPESCFMVPDVHDAAVKLEDGSAAGAASVFTDVDQSCNYLLPLQLYDQSGVLPWWDWPEISR